MALDEETNNNNNNVKREWKMRNWRAEIFFGRGASVREVHTHRTLGNLREDTKETNQPNVLHTLQYIDAPSDIFPIVNES